MCLHGDRQQRNLVEFYPAIILPSICPLLLANQPNVQSIEKGTHGRDLTAGLDYSGFICCLLPWRLVLCIGNIQIKRWDFLIRPYFKLAYFFILEALRQ